MIENIEQVINNLKNCDEIDDVCEYIASIVGTPVWFDGSRAWSVYSVKQPNPDDTRFARRYGAYRPYLGGDMRGGIYTNQKDEYGILYTEGLKRIEAIINRDTEGMEPWEQNTGVLL